MEKQAKLKKYAEKIQAFYVRNKRMPSYSEMMVFFKLRSKNSVFKRIALLVREGLAEKDNNGRLLPLKMFNKVKVLGHVNAGFPSPAEEELVDTMSLDEYLISNPQATYLLKVEGNSMIDAGIHADDLVLVQKNLTPKNGDIVVAQVDNEWTLKYFELKGTKVSLRAANKDYPVIIPKQELIIAGVVIANVRKYR